MTTPGPILPCNSAAGSEGDPAMRTITMASEVKERPGNYQDRSGCARDFGRQGVIPPSEHRPRASGHADRRTRADAGSTTVPWYRSPAPRRPVGALVEVPGKRGSLTGDRRSSHASGRANEINHPWPTRAQGLGEAPEWKLSTPAVSARGAGAHLFRDSPLGRVSARARFPWLPHTIDRHRPP